MAYIDVPLVTDPDELAAESLDYLIASIPGWTPQEGHLDVWMIEVMARMVAEARDVASRVPRSIFRYYGRTLLNLPPVDAAPARVDSTWTMVDNQGYSVPPGTVVAFRLTGDRLVAFRNLTEIVVSPNETTTLAGSVLLEAVEEGSEPNGLTGPMELVDSLAYVASVTATTVATGGADRESDDAYLDRLARELELLTPRPIKPDDFSVLAQRTAGVYRAQTIDNYDPATATFNNERMVTVVGLDRDGAALGAAVEAELVAELEAMREVNFVVNTTDPGYTAIDVVYEVVAAPGWANSVVKDAADEAIIEYLRPGNFGGGLLSPPIWMPATHVRFTAVVGRLSRVPGVAYVKTMTLNGGTVDIALANTWTLPAAFDDPVAPSTVTGTVIGDGA